MVWNSYCFKRLCNQADTTLRSYINATKTTSGIGDDSSFPEVKPNVIYKEDESMIYESEVAANEKILDNESLIGKIDGIMPNVLAAERIDSLLIEKVDEKTATTTLFECSHCHRSFAMAQTLARHMKIHQSDQYNKLCQYCEKSFMRADDLKRHIRIHTGERPYACDKCPKRYKQSSELKEHHRSHSADKLFVCQFCGRSLATRNGLYVHLKVHRGDKKHECNLCGKRFVSSGEVKSHLRNRHKEVNNKEKSK